MTAIHETEALRHFVIQNIGAWSGEAIVVHLRCGLVLPKIRLELYEFSPKTQELVWHVQYMTNIRTGEQKRVIKASPPLGMTLREKHDLDFYENYVDQILDKHFTHFAQVCYAEEVNDFQVRLLQMMRELMPSKRQAPKVCH